MISFLPKERQGKFIFTGIFGMSLAFILISHSEVPLPIHATTSFVPFEVHVPKNLPFSTEKNYAHLVSLGRIELVYEDAEQSMSVWATTQLGWNHVDGWEQYPQTIEDAPVFFNETDELTILSWQRDGVEYAIDYKGHQLSKHDLFDVATSMN